MNLPQENVFEAENFPRLHRVHEFGWINDPNGIHRDEHGRYQVCFQFNPTSTRHHLIRWGRMSSPDLISWREESDALIPTEFGLDRAGCWSGSAFLSAEADAAEAGVTASRSKSGPVMMAYSGTDGKSRIAHTLVADPPADPTDPLACWQQRPDEVATFPPESGVVDARDPFLVNIEGRRYALHGAGLANGHAAVTVHDATLDDYWPYLGLLLTSEHVVAGEYVDADVWECPQLLQVDGRWALIVSLMRNGEELEDGTFTPATQLGVSYLLGEVSVMDGCPKFEPSAGGRLDKGPDFYAAHAASIDGRALVWGWSPESDSRTQAQTDAQGWAGTLTFPRELRVVAERLVGICPQELRGLRGAEISADESGQISIPLGVPFEVVAKSNAKIVLRRPDGSHHLVTEADQAARFFVDGSIVEVFDLTNPMPSKTRRIYPRQGEEWVVSGADVRVFELSSPNGK